jgi:hypothetical protein
VATSYGAQHAVAANIEKAIQQFGQEERARLAKQMSHREITLCEDETFHPQICLVAIEPVSNYLILEEYAAKRDAATWNVAISEALKPLSVTVTQVRFRSSNRLDFPRTDVPWRSSFARLISCPARSFASNQCSACSSNPERTEDPRYCQCNTKLAMLAKVSGKTIIHST